MKNLHNLINEALQLHENGKIQDAIRLYLKILENEKNDSQLLFLLGTAYIQIGNTNLGIEKLKKSIFLKPENLFAHSNLGNAFKDLKRYEDAITSYDKAIEINPNYAEIHNNKGNALKNLESYDEAIKSYDKAIKIKSDYAFAHNNKGNALKNLESYDEAIESYDKAIEINPNYFEAHHNKGNVLKDLKRFDEAIASYNKAIEIKPDYHFSYNNRGIIFQHLNNIEKALASYDKAIEINPNYPETYNNKGNILKELKRYDEALICYEKSIKLKSDFDYMLGKVLNINMFLCNWIEFDPLIKEINNTIDKKSKIIEPFTFLGLTDNPVFLKLSSESYIKNNFKKNLEIHSLAKYTNHKKPRIGYFSADFHNHATLHLMMDIFKNHNKSNFDFYGFSFGPQNNNDSWNSEVKNYFLKFEDVSNISDKEIAYLSRKLEIDIAIDLKGLTSNSRNGIFSYRAAPIQINYLGYPGTTGADYMDYIIADEVIIPKEYFENYTEKVLYLPNCYQPNKKKRDISKKRFKRSDFGLPENSFIYCCFNSNYKITPQIFDIWMNILKAVPNSVLWIFKTNETASKNLKRESKAKGVDPSRIIFASYLPNDEHLKRISFADLFLDTFPCNAHTTASDAVRMCVPIVTLIGRSFASRVAASILSCLDLKQLITSDEKEYQKLAIDLARHPRKINEIKDRLKNAISTSPLFDSSKFTKHLENIYLQLMK